ncbi:MAG: cysteine peptidase family C39 domain-containing protein [Gammaproteobacteria bacterium]|nr:cysteine peptidase family C39 domain-containing protein [Gammaproteobacteria bacterium]
MTDRLSLNGKRRLPVILQSETAECGLACLAMVAAVHGNTEGLISMRQRFGIGARGATLGDLIETGNQLGLTARALQCEVDDLSKLSVPAILHWDFTHFVVLKHAGARRITIHDPAVGARTYPLAEAGKHFTGVALGIEPGADFEACEAPESAPLSSFFSGLGSLVPNLAQILFLSALLQLVALGTPFYMQLVVDEVWSSTTSICLRYSRQDFSD